MPKAQSSRDIPAIQDERDSREVSRTKRRNAETSFEGKTFENLDPKEEKQLLKELAIRAGILKDS